MKTYWGVGILFHHSRTRHYSEREWSGSRPGSFTPAVNAPSIYSIGGWVGLGAGLNIAEQIKILPFPGFEPRNVSPQPSTIPTKVS
jgi:hypothetical protein